MMRIRNHYVSKNKSRAEPGKKWDSLLRVLGSNLSIKKSIFELFFKQNRIIWTTPSCLSAKNTPIDRTTFDFAMSGKWLLKINIEKIDFRLEKNFQKNYFFFIFEELIIIRIHRKPTIKNQNQSSKTSKKE